MRGVRARVPVPSRFENFEAFGSDAHIAELDLGSQGDYVDYLQCQLARIGVAAVDMICEEGDVEAAEVRY